MVVEERRTSSRAAANLGAALLDSENSMYLGKGKIVDISAGGIKLETAAKLEVGSKINMNFILQKGEYMSRTGMSITGEVEAIWKTASGKLSVYGLKFMKLSAIDKERIREYVKFKTREREMLL